MNIAILILAAGRSRRFGSDKRQARLPDGQSLLQHSVQSAVDSGLPTVVCLRPGDEALAEELEALGASTLLCPHAEQGMAHTLAEGIAGAQDYDGVLVALGDMPDILPATYCKAAETLVPGGICQPQWNGTPGHPVGFSRAFFPALAALTGDRGARELVKKNREMVTHLPVDDPGILRDIDTPADIRQQRLTADAPAPAGSRSP